MKYIGNYFIGTECVALEGNNLTSMIKSITESLKNASESKFTYHIFLKSDSSIVHSVRGYKNRFGKLVYTLKEKK